METRIGALKEIMTAAYNRAYRGDGCRWGWLADADVERVIGADEHVVVLRSELFCRHYWQPRIVAHQMAPGQGSGLIYNKVSAEDFTQWERHFSAVQSAPDPLTYCYMNGPGKSANG